MNNKGFTLVEMLAVVVILALVGGIATVGVINTINTSKIKSEKIFVDKLSNLIDDYIGLYSSELEISSPTDKVEFRKCEKSSCETYNNNNSYKVEATKMNSIRINNLINRNIISKDKLVNPKNKLQCFLEEKNPEIHIYRDDEYVYYYYVDLSGTNTSCDISEENAIINTLPDNLSSEVGLS